MRYVIGDIHGGYRALKELLDSVNFDYEIDELYSVGDVCDGWSETAECFELLLSIKHFYMVMGNHDEWCLEFLIKTCKNTSSIQEKKYSQSWLQHGGSATIESYRNKPELMYKHMEFLKTVPYFRIIDNILIVHAGFEEEIPGVDHIHDPSLLCWTRKFWQKVYSGRNIMCPYSLIYIGHTPTLNFPKNDGEHLKPMKRNIVINIDTGATFTGRLSMINIDTNELHQSTKLIDLYPNERGRN